MKSSLRQHVHVLSACACILATFATNAAAQSTLPAPMRASIDSIVRDALASTGTPSVSIAVVKNGEIAYANAYGSARLSPNLPAAPSMRYSIGSVSKQFTATAVLMLAEQHKLSLDDRVSRWLPSLTRANEVTVRELLAMQSGYQDYWPEDYVMTSMLVPTSAQHILDVWGRKPLDFDPGTRWQYSNTNYVIAGRIVEMVSGMPLVEFLRRRVFTPLRLHSVLITDEGALGPTDPERYERFGLGPPRVAPKEANGWMFAAGELAMTASDLARWDIAMMDRRLLSPASYHAQQSDIPLKDGRASGYGLGVFVGSLDGHRMLQHGGEVSGFTSRNNVFPDDRVAVVVLSNLFVTDAPSTIARAVSELLLAEPDTARERLITRVRDIVAGLQHGTIDRSQLTPFANAWFSEQALADFSSSLSPLGSCADVSPTSRSLRGGMTYRGFLVRCGGKALSVSTFIMPDGRFEQFIITPE